MLQNKSSINQSLYTEAIYANITTHLAARCEQNTCQNFIIVSLSNQYTSNTCLKLQDTMKTIKVVRSYTIIAAMCQHLIQRISILTKNKVETWNNVCRMLFQVLIFFHTFPDASHLGVTGTNE